jgi:hypothetical protein
MDATEDVSDRVTNAVGGVSKRVAAVGAAGIITLCIFFVQLIIKGFG